MVDGVDRVALFCEYGLGFTFMSSLNDKVMIIAFSEAM